MKLRIRLRKRQRWFPVLPTMITLGNAVCGFGAITFAFNVGPEGSSTAVNGGLFTAALLVYLGMVFDMLDGHMARLTKQISNFGAELDSMCDVITFGDAKTAISPEPVLAAVRKLGTNVAINMLGSGVEERPDLFASLFPAVVDIHAKYGRPHWVLVDEAHHMLPYGRDAGAGLNIGDQPPAIFVTVHPDALATTSCAASGSF